VYPQPLFLRRGVHRGAEIDSLIAIYLRQPPSGEGGGTGVHEEEPLECRMEGRMSETGMQVRGALIPIVVFLAGLWAAGSWIYHHMIAPRAPTAKVSVAPPPSPAPKKIDTDPFQPKKVSNYPIIQLLDKQLEKLSMSPSAVECRNIAPVL